jgi:hypothetical protein
MRHLRWFSALALLATAGAVPLRAQLQDWQHQWYWGAKGGVTMMSLPTTGTAVSPAFGGEWMITARRTALYLSYSMTTTAQLDNFTNFKYTSATVPIAFDGMGRIQIAVLVLPWSGKLQPYLGGGFVIETLANAGLPVGTTLVPAVETIVTRDLPGMSSGGFALLMGGVQLRMGKAALFGQFQVSPQGHGFLLTGSAVSLEFGLRYAMSSSREDDITTRR